MSQAQKDHKIFKFDKDVREAVLGGADTTYRAVTTTYGPKGRNVLLEKTFGFPIITRDGVTVARESYSKVRDENAAMQLLIQAADTTNSSVGDGTTATVALTYHLIKKVLSFDYDAMGLKDTLEKDSRLLLDELKKYTKPLKKGQLEQVATVSSRDSGLGKMIAQAVEETGNDGGIIAEKAELLEVEREYIEGYFIQKGFMAITQGKRQLVDPVVAVVSHKLSTATDIAELLDKVAQAQGLDPRQGDKLRIAIFGSVEGEAYARLVELIAKGVLDATVVESPEGGELGSQYLEDIATYTGGRIISASSLKDLDKSYLGSADRIVCSKYNTSIFGGKYIKEDYDLRLADLKDNLKEEQFANIAEKIKDRIAKLSGKVAIFRIGGATKSEKEELEFRIEDAIQAAKAAFTGGVVPGGGTTLVWLSQTKGLSKITREALRETFKRLVDNANFPAEVKLEELLKAKSPMGFNLATDGELVDLEKEGILDPAQVIEETVRNATSIAGNLITLGAMIIFEDKPEEK